MAMRCEYEAFLGSLTHCYCTFVTARQLDVRLDLELRGKLGAAEISDLSPLVQARREDRFVVAGPQFEFSVDWTARRSRSPCRQSICSITPSGDGLPR